MLLLSSRSFSQHAQGTGTSVSHMTCYLSQNLSLLQTSLSKIHHYPTFAEVRKLSVISFHLSLPSLFVAKAFKAWFLPLFPAPFVLIQLPRSSATDHSLQILEWAQLTSLFCLPVSSCFSVVPTTVIFSILASPVFNTTTYSQFSSLMSLLLRILPYLQLNLPADICFPQYLSA